MIMYRLVYELSYLSCKKVFEMSKFIPNFDIMIDHCVDEIMAMPISKITNRPKRIVLC